MTLLYLHLVDLLEGLAILYMEDQAVYFVVSYR
jgi:hypothetical protein